jgi:hypothetical protein
MLELNEGTYAGVLKKLGKLDEAETHYEMALSIDNKNPHILGKKSPWQEMGCRKKLKRTRNEQNRRWAVHADCTMPPLPPPFFSPRQLREFPETISS